MRHKVLFGILLCCAAPVLAAQAHGGGGPSFLDVALKVLNVAAFFGLIIYVMARPLRGFFETHTETIQNSIHDSLAKEQAALDLESQARALMASVETEVDALRSRFAADRVRVQQDLDAATQRALARLRTDHERSLSQLEASFRGDLIRQHLGV